MSSGWCRNAGISSGSTLRVSRLLDPGERAAMRRRMAQIARPNGAEEAAGMVREMALTLRADRPG